MQCSSHKRAPSTTQHAIPLPACNAPPTTISLQSHKGFPLPITTYCATLLQMACYTNQSTLFPLAYPINQTTFFLMACLFNYEMVVWQDQSTKQRSYHQQALSTTQSFSNLRVSQTMQRFSHWCGQYATQCYFY